VLLPKFGVVCVCFADLTLRVSEVEVYSCLYEGDE
jgi:hypothetical protein